MSPGAELSRLGIDAASLVSFESFARPGCYISAAAIGPPGTPRDHNAVRSTLTLFYPFSP
eukprot:3309302-Pyramimonas_sp.AAC.1